MRAGASRQLMAACNEVAPGLGERALAYLFIDGRLAKVQQRADAVPLHLHYRVLIFLCSTLSPGPDSATGIRWRTYATSHTCPVLAKPCFLLTKTVENPVLVFRFGSHQSCNGIRYAGESDPSVQAICAL